jgi:hypothetical protein
MCICIDVPVNQMPQSLPLVIQVRNSKVFLCSGVFFWVLISSTNLGAEYSLDTKQFGLDLNYTPLSNASNAHDQQTGQIRLASKWVQMHGEYAVVTLDNNNNAHLTPLLGTAVMAPYFGQMDELDMKKQKDTDTNAMEGMARVKRAAVEGDQWTSVEYVAPRDADEAAAKLLSKLANQMDLGDDDDVEALNAPAVVDEKKVAAPIQSSHNTSTCNTPYLQYVMVSRDVSFQHEERQRAKAAATSSLKEIVADATTDVATKVALVMQVARSLQWIEVRERFDVRDIADEVLLENLAKCAWLVRGVWVCSSYHGESEFEAMKGQEVLENSLRKVNWQWQYLLWTLGRDGLVRRRTFCTATGCLPALAETMLQCIAVLNSKAKPDERMWMLRLGPCLESAKRFPQLALEQQELHFGDEHGPRLLEQIASVGFGGRRVKRERVGESAPVRVKREMEYEEVRAAVIELFLRYGVVAHADLVRWGVDFPDNHLRNAVDRMLVAIKPKLFVLSPVELQPFVEKLDPRYVRYREIVLGMLVLQDGSTPVVKKQQFQEEAKKHGLPPMSATLYKHVIWSVARASGTNWTIKTGRFADDPKSSTSVG